MKYAFYHYILPLAIALLLFFSIVKVRDYVFAPKVENRIGDGVVDTKHEKE